MASELIPKDEVDALLDQFETEFSGLSKWQTIQEPKYLHMSLEELRKKTPQELTEGLIEIHRYTLSLERLIGRLSAWKLWGKSKLEDFAASNLEKISTSFSPFERTMIAKTQPPECKKISQFVREIEMKLQRLYQVPQHIKVIADSIRDLRYINLNREKSYNQE